MRFDSLKKLKKELGSIKKEVVATLKSGFKELFVEFPELKSFRWTQYAPYFNDGEPCEFSVNEIEYLLEGDDSDKDEWRCPPYKGGTELDQAIRDLDQLFSSFEDDMRTAFGNDVKVTVTKDKIEIEHYDHD